MQNKRIIQTYIVMVPVPRNCRWQNHFFFGHYSWIIVDIGCVIFLGWRNYLCHWFLIPCWFQFCDPDTPFTVAHHILQYVNYYRLWSVDLLALLVPPPPAKNSWLWAWPAKSPGTKTWLYCKNRHHKTAVAISPFNTMAKFCACIIKAAQLYQAVVIDTVNFPCIGRHFVWPGPMILL